MRASDDARGYDCINIESFTAPNRWERSVNKDELDRRSFIIRIMLFATDHSLVSTPMTLYVQNVESTLLYTPIHNYTARHAYRISSSHPDLVRASDND